MQPIQVLRPVPFVRAVEGESLHGRPKGRGLGAAGEGLVCGDVCAYVCVCVFVYVNVFKYMCMPKLGFLGYSLLGKSRNIIQSF